VDVFLDRKIGERHRVGDVDIDQFEFTGRAGVAGGNIDLLQARRLGKFPGQRMFAAAAADDE
jgi:hypothetical protein